uniref:Leucine-rich repeat-containing N-terminal plant-type domain-containing protein n=1 Tax=Brassica oleracea TaxID=3712 RepID=A0A3P6D5U8_BRAOL|nr:unnamed protein product [Brassica oleracea]
MVSPGIMAHDGDSNSLLSLVSFLLFLFITATAVTGDSMDSDREVLLSFKSYLESWNPTERGKYNEWETEKQDVCPLFGNFSALTQLAFLDLSNNTIGGSIPDDLNRCHNLKHLNLSLNIIEEELSFSGLSNLEVLDLSVNQIAGDIHSTFPTLCNRLVVANLSTNNFSGRIDDIFNEGNCNLQVLDLSGNGFVGEFPGQVLNCQNLNVLDLWGNNFTGNIPAEIGSISSLRGFNLVFLDLSRNNFGGELQEIFGRFTQSLMFLVLAYNNFSGDIPREYGNMPRLQALDLSFSRLTGSIPASFGKLTSLLWLMLANNSLSGEIPREIGNCSSLLWLNVANNQLSGKLPIEIGLLPLAFLNLTRNKFSGQIPKEIGNIYNLQNLDLSSNNFSGNFPTSLNDLSAMSKFNISYNPLITGVIPSTGQLTTFEKDSFLGNPLLQFPSFVIQSGNNNTSSGERDNGRDEDAIDMLAFYWSTFSFYVVALVGILVLVYFDCPWCRAWLRLVDAFTVIIAYEIKKPRDSKSHFK